MGFKISIKFGEDEKFKECKELIDKAYLTKDIEEQSKLIDLALRKARNYGIYFKVVKYLDDVFGR
jgi:hypothetical protein